MSNITCPAFFTGASVDTEGSFSPCCAAGFDNYPGHSLKTIWLHPTQEKRREQAIAGEKLPMCSRCFVEESVGSYSERQFYLKDGLPQKTTLEYTDPAYYTTGPTHLKVRVGNLCNLRCRTCQSSDSYLYYAEGKQYEEKYGIQDTIYTIGGSKRKQFTDEQLDDLFEFSANVETLSLFGGEPFIDDQIFKYLQRLTDSGRSKQIYFLVSTNATRALNNEWRNVIRSFNEVMINISIDAVGPEFTYMRHPGNWETVEANIKEMIEFAAAERAAGHKVQVSPVITVSALNVWHLPKILEYFSQYDIAPPFIILVQHPSYYCVNVLPSTIKPEVEEYLRSFNDHRLDPVINLMYTKPRVSDVLYPDCDTPWEEFKFWTKAKDEYRSESYTDTFKEFGQLLISQRKW